MEILQTILEAITTPNLIAMNIVGGISCLIEAFVNMLIFTTLLNIKSDKKSKLIYVFSISTIALISRLLIPDPYGTLSNIIIHILLIKIIFKISILKSILSTFLPILIDVIIEWILLKVFLEIFNIDFEQVISIPLYRFIYSLVIYLCMYIIYLFIKYFKLNINVLDSMSIRKKILLSLSFILGIITLSVQLYLISFYSNTMPLGIVIVSIISLISYFFINIYSLLNITKLEITSQDLEQAKSYNNTLMILHDSIRGFKHDLGNIVQGIGGYLDRNDLDGLKTFLSQFQSDVVRVNNIAALNPYSINNPAIYNILATKYSKADALNVEINFEIFLDLNEIEKNMKIYEFTRTLGILMDNAIESAADCEKKIVTIIIRKDASRHRLLLIIENTYANKDIDTEQIYEKGFSTKKENTGLGLWEVRQILKRNNNLSLYTSKNEEYFKQQFEIYY